MFYDYVLKQGAIDILQDGHCILKVASLHKILKYVNIVYFPLAPSLTAKADRSGYRILRGVGRHQRFNCGTVSFHCNYSTN